MPAVSGSMDTGMGVGGAPPPPPPAEKPEWWASSAVVGLMGFGTTTMVAGLTNLPTPYSQGFGGNWVVYGMAIFFGGLAQLIAGVIALRKGNLFAGSAFMGYGAFWLAYWQLAGSLNAALGSATPGPAAFYGVAGFAFIWMLFTFSFMINSIKHGWGITFVFVFLFISFALLVAKFWSLAANLGGCTDATDLCGPFAFNAAANWIVGGIIIFTGFVAWYVATAQLTESTYGRKVLPH
jgi:uncharacterized protein